MTRIITPGLFLVAAMLASACTDPDDDPAPPPDDDHTGVAECCATETPHNGEPLIDTVGGARRARERLDWLRRAHLRR